MATMAVLLVAFSGEGIYHAVPSNYLNAPMSSGFTYGFAVHVYLT